MTWEFIATGALIGTLVGFTGMGGGSLMTPILIFVFGFNPSLAVGTDIFHGAIFKTFGAIRHRRLGNVQARLSGWMFLASAPMSLLGVSVSTWMKHAYGDSVQSVQGRVLGAALIFGAFGLVAKTVMRRRVIGAHTRMTSLTNRDRLAAVAIGFFGGFIVGLTSVGSGTFFGLTMLIVFPLGAVKVVGTDIFHAAALLWVAGFGHIVAGNVDMSVAGWLLVGSIPGVLVGSQMSMRIPERALRLALAIVLAMSGIKLLEPPGANGIVIGGLIAGGLALGAWGVFGYLSHARTPLEEAPASSTTSRIDA
jgi:uncharacterized protein